MENRLRLVPRETERTVRKQPVPIIALNSKGVIVRANPQARRSLARSGIQPEGMTLADCIVTLVQHGMAGTRLEVPGPQGEESILLVLSEAEPARRPRPPAETAGPPAREETPRPQQTEEQLGKVSPVSDFLAHELRNPLNTILGIAEILEERLPSMPVQESLSAIGTIRGESERALVIIRSLLALAEGRQRTETTRGRVPLHAVVRRVTEAHNRVYPDRKFVISGDSPLFARGDADWVQLAISNLVANAEKYTPKDLPIEIELRLNGSWATALVLDRGQTLNPNLYRSLWEIYKRGAEPEVLVTGSGIGLHLCKRLVQEMGGHVWAGPRESGGSAFSISLPVNFDMTVPEPLFTSLSEGVA